MKLQELLKEKKHLKTNKLKLVVTESQFRSLAKNVLKEQEQGTIKRTQLIKSKFNAKKN